MIRLIDLYRRYFIETRKQWLAGGNMVMTNEEIWATYLSLAEGLKQEAGDLAPVQGIPGRSITALVDKLAEFWADHRDTLVPFLTSLAIAALEAILAQRGAIDQVNKPGPQ